MAETPESNTNDIQRYPFLVKTLITFTKTNNQGSEEKVKDDVVFKLDRASAKMPWYVLRNYSVPKYLNKTYGPYEVAWQRIYEIRIMKVINRANPNDCTDIPLRVMTLEQLAAYCERWELSVPVMEFYSVEKAREMVALRQVDEKGYERHLREYREGKQRSYPELDGMRGDAEAPTTESSEFDRLDKKTTVPKIPKPKKSAAPSEEVETTKKDGPALQANHPPNRPGIGDQPVASDPFAGV